MNYVIDKHNSRKHNKGKSDENADINFQEFIGDQNIDEVNLEQAYKKFHHYNFDEITRKNQHKIKNEFLTKVQDDFLKKKEQNMVSRSQFGNLQSQMAFLPKKARDEKVIFNTMFN